MRRFSLTALDTTVIATSFAAGLILPFALFPLWRLATRDHTLMSLNTFSSISSLLFPGRYGVFLGWNGPRDQTRILTMWIRALAQNALVYAILGFLVVIALRLSKALRRDRVQPSR